MSTQPKILKLTPRYLKTGDMATFIGHSTRWLKERKDVDFIKGIHYQQREDMTYPVWVVKKIDEWLCSTETNEEIDSILNKVI